MKKKKCILFFDAIIFWVILGRREDFKLIIDTCMYIEIYIK